MDEMNDSTRDAATFAARSVGLGRKSFGFSQPVLGVQPMDGNHMRTISDQDSDLSLSGTTSPHSSAVKASTSDPHNGTALQPRSVSLPTSMSHSMPSDQRERPPPLPPKLPPKRVRRPRTADPAPRHNSPPMVPDYTHQQRRISMAEMRSQTLPARKFITTSSLPPTPPLPRPSMNHSSPVPPPPPPTPAPTPTSTPRAGVHTAEQLLSRDRSLHLRLASLPPPMMARYNTQGSARLTPSVVHRPMPMPILNLPTLPPPSPGPHSGEWNGRRGARLRSMPALPLNGPRDDENPDMDEEGSDSSDEGEGDDGDDHSMMRDEGGSDEEPDTPSPLLPEVDTSPLGISASFIAGRSAVAQRKLREIEQQAAALVSPPPKDSTSPSPTFPARTSSLDYFSHKALVDEPSQDAPRSDDIARTPRPSDFMTRPSVTIPSAGNDAETSESSSQELSDPGPSGFGVLPKIVPIPPTPRSSLPPSLSPRSPTYPGRIVGQSTITSASPEAFRPGLYHHASKSMVDLTPYSRKTEKMKEELAERNRTPLVESSIPEGSSQDGHAEAHLGASANPQLRRQRSLPTYSPASVPPPYPAFLGHQPIHNIQPREEEGNEKLPPYSNSLLLVAMMPRKMEFVAPGQQARERKWRRVIVVLEGTALRVYRTHGAGTHGKGGKVGEWWERAVGVGDWSSGQGVGGPSGSQGVRASALRERERRLAGGDQAPVPPLKGEREPEEPPRPPSIHESPTLPTSASRSTFFQSATGLLHPSRSGQGSRLGTPTSADASRSRLSFETGQSMDESRTPTGMAGRPSVDAVTSSNNNSRSTFQNSSPTVSVSISGHRTRTGSSNANASSYTNMSAYSSSGSSTHRAKGRSNLLLAEPQQVPVPDEKDLLRVYTLQNAESGLASDYTKRKNVIRLRTEGEQFLLQARDVGGVIDWIEV